MVETLFATGLIAVALVLFMAIALPPLQYLFQTTSFWLDSLISEYHFTWLYRSAAESHKASYMRQKRRFRQWIESRARGEFSGSVDDEVTKAADLIPLLRCLLEDEIPKAIRRCNKVHYVLAIAVNARHMREIAAEPECLQLRRFVVQLLFQTADLLKDYPPTLLLEADDLLHASLAVRRSLLPTCSRCPYIQQSVASAGIRCPASELIQVEVAA
jgi:hypothetical protein